MHAVKYEVRLAGSKEAVAASPEEGAVVAVGSGAPLRGFQTALKSMKEGERASLKLKPECACVPHALGVTSCHLETPSIA